MAAAYFTQTVDADQSNQHKRVCIVYLYIVNCFGNLQRPLYIVRDLL